MISLEVNNLTKYFGQRKVFKDLSFIVEDNSCLVVIGKNGSGKTTLLKILAGLYSPNEGEIKYNLGGKTIKKDRTKKFLSLVAPDLNLYDELTALENLKFLSKIQSLSFGEDDLFKKIHDAGLKGRENDLIGSFSSGMKQKLKYVFALLNQPKFLLLDEPSSNLDEDGIAYLEKIISEQKKKGILILATNNKKETEYGEKILSLDN